MKKVLYFIILTVAMTVGIPTNISVSDITVSPMMASAEEIMVDEEVEKEDRKEEGTEVEVLTVKGNSIPLSELSEKED